MLSLYETRLVTALHQPIIIDSANPRKDRMRYINAMNNTRSKVLSYAFKAEKSLSILTCQKAERIIIGPKDFDAYLPLRFDLNTCTKEELAGAFRQTYELPLIDLELLERQITNAARITITSNPLEELEKESSDALASLGFGKKS